MKNKTAIWIVILILLLIGVYLYFTRNNDDKDTIVANDVVCTLDTKLCTDGSYVSRNGPNCLFDTCPVPKTVTPPVVDDQIFYPADIYK